MSDNNNEINKNKKPVEEKTVKKAGQFLIDYARNECNLFSNSQNKPYVSIWRNGHWENWGVNSSEFSDFLRSLYYNETKKGLNKNTLEDAISTIAAAAVFDGYKKEVHLRVAQEDKIIYIDLCNKDWQILRISNGGWSVVDTAPVTFTRTSNMKPLPKPMGGNGIKKLLKYININESELVLLAGWMSMALQAGDGAYPVLMINGPAGSGKSSACRFIRALIDPNKADLISQPSVSNMPIAASNCHILSIDNVSNVSPQISDALCKISTGDHQIMRELYTTNKEVVMSFKKPVMLNGIPEMGKRSDLASRSLKLTLNKIVDRKTEAATWAAFNEDAPSIFKGLLDGQVMALANYDNIELDNMTRMADFCKWATATHGAYDWSETAFIDAYTKNVKASYADSLESSPFATAIQSMCENRAGFYGRPLELLNLIEINYASDKVVRSPTWVKSPKGVIEQLDRHEESFEAVGIVYKKYKDRTNKTHIKIGSAQFIETCVKTKQVKYTENDF